MKGFAMAAAKLMPRLEKQAERTDALMDRVAADPSLTTEQAIEKMLARVERKRAMCELSRLYPRMTSLLTPRERFVFESRSRGMTEEALAAALGVSRGTVVRTYLAALKKCAWFLGAAKKVNDFTLFRSIGLMIEKST